MRSFWQLDKFRATTVDAIQASGSWVYGGTLYQDLLIRVSMDCSDSADAYEFFRAYKEVLKSRFEQIDIWITAHDVDVI